jgi:hypothetical protein
MDQGQTPTTQNLPNKRKRGHKRVNSIYTFEIKDDGISAHLVEPKPLPL